MKKVSFFALALCSLTSLSAQTIQEGLKYVDMEQFSNARRVFSTLAQDVSNADNQFYFGDFLLKQDKADSAAMYFEKGLLANPKNQLNVVGKGAVSLMKGDAAGAAAQFDLARKASKDKDGTVLFKIGEAYSRKKENYDKAIEVLLKAVAVDKKNTDAMLLLGDVYLWKEDGTQAVRYYEEALKVNPKLAKAMIREGKIWVRAKNYKQGLEYYQKGRDLDPDYAPAYRELAELYSMARQNENALTNYKKYMSLSDGNPETRYRYAQFLFLNKVYSDALAEIAKLPASFDNNFYVRRLKAYCNYEASNYPVGMENSNAFFQMVDKENILASDYEYKGKLMIKSGQDSLGALEILRAVEMDSSKADLIQELVKTNFEAKKYGKAAYYYEQLFKYKKPGVNEVLNYGKALYFNSSYKQADSVFAKLIEMKPDNVLGYKYRALVNKEQDPKNKTGVAVPYYEKYITFAMTDPVKYKKDLVDAYSYLGVFYSSDKKTWPKSKENFTKVLEFDPANENARSALKILNGGK